MYETKAPDGPRFMGSAEFDAIANPILKGVAGVLKGYAADIRQSLIDQQVQTSEIIRTVDKKAEEAKSTAIAALRPRSQGRPVSPRTVVIRSAVSRIVAFARKHNPERVADELYGAPTTASAVLDLGGYVARSQTNPAMTTVNGWAAELVGPAKLSTLALLAPRSTYAALQARGLTLDFSGFGSVRLPARSGSGDISGGFVGENNPIPVQKAVLTSGLLVPHKWGVISTFTKELTTYSTPAIESAVRDLITNDTTSAIDAALLGSGAGSAIRPPGLLNGLVSLTPTTGGGLAAVAGDFAALAGAIPNAQDLVFIMAEATRVRALALAPGLAGVTIISSAVVPASRVIAIDANDFFSASADPSFDVSESSTIVPDDTAPGAVMSPPTTSMFQQGLIGLRFLETTTWGTRQAGRVQFIDPISW